MHAVCACLDHVAAATCKPQETVGVEVAEVASAQPAVDQGRGGRLRRVPVPGHDIVAAGTDLAGLARRSFTAVHSPHPDLDRSEEHTSELQSLMRISYAVFCLIKKNQQRADGELQADTHTNKN